MFGQGFIPDDFNGEYCCYSVEWPSSPKWLAVLRGVLTMPAQGRFWDKNTGTITEAQEQIKPTFDNNLHLQEVIMACNSPELALIADAINNLALAQCCGNGEFSGRGSGGAGTSRPPLSEVTQAEILADPEEHGFTDEEEFLSDKCAIANDIIETLKADLGKLAISNLFGMSHTSFAALIAITLATPIPIDDIIAIAALLLSIGSVVVVTTSLSILNDNDQELLCDLFNGTDAASSKSLFLDHFGELADIGIADPVTNFAAKSFMSYMLGPAVVNRLYYKDLTRIWEGGDCSECEEEPANPFEIVYEGTDCDPASMEWIEGQTWEFTSGCIFGGFLVSAKLADGVNRLLTFELSDGTLSVHPSVPYRPIWNHMQTNYTVGGGTVTYQSNTFPPTAICCDYWGCMSGDAFKIRVTVGEEC